MSISLSQISDLSVQSEDFSFATDFGSDNGNNRVSHCIFTGFPDSHDPKWLLPDTYFTDTSILLNWCGQFESTKDNVLHFHVYMQFKNKHRLRFNTLRSTLSLALGKGCNIKLPKHRVSEKSRACMVNYVLAPSKRAENTSEYIWPHSTKTLTFDAELFENRSTKKSKQDVDEERRLHIESKPKHWTWDQILHENEQSKQLLCTCSWGPKYHASRFAETPRRTIANVIILYGAGGTGKTTLAQKWDTRDDEDYFARYYKRNHDDGKFWGGGRTAYRGQRIIHLEEFCGQESCSLLKEICDIEKYGPSINIKNGGTELNHDTIIITSNHHPAAWYRHLWRDQPKQWMPVARRFTQVWFFPECRPDGSPNIPSSDTPPYSVDQSEEFATLVNNYQGALDHAANCWPIQEADTYDATTATVYQPGFNPAKRMRLN